MSWLNLNQSLSGLKGQFKNLANEVFSEGIVEDTDPFTELSAANDKIKELQNLCGSQDAEIKTLRRQNSTLHQEKLDALSKNNGANTSASVKPHAGGSEESSWFWDPPDGEAASNSQNTENSDTHKLQKKICELQNEISDLKDNKERDSYVDSNELYKEINALKEENKNLTLSLEDLDNQNQIAMNKVITIKRELQKNYEELQTKYEALEKENNEFKIRLKEFDGDKSGDMKEVTERNKKLLSDIDNLHHKYDNLEKVHRLLTENTEKFQEDNMELSEENFRLQEECSRLQNDLEELQAVSQSAPKKYKELENKFFELERKFAERDNPKSVDSMLETIHDSKAKEIIAQLKFEIVELQNKLNTNEEIKRLNLEIDHLKKEVESLACIKIKSIPCDTFKNIIDKYVTFDINGIQKPSTTSTDELLNYAEVCYKNISEIKSKNETLEIRISESSRTINNLQSNVDELSAEMEILNGDIQHYEHECSELKKNNDFLIAEIGALKSVSKLEPILEHNEEHLAKLQCELDDSCKLNKSFKTEMAEKDKQLQVMADERDKLKQEVSKLKIDLDRLKESQLDASNSDNLQKKLTSTLSELDKLKSQLHSVTVDNEKSKIDITILDNDKILLLREISELKASLQTKSIVEDYAKKIESEKVELESKLNGLLELELLVEHLGKENNDLKNRLSSLDESAESHSKIIEEELTKYKSMAVDSAKTLSEKDQELELVKSKTLGIEQTLQEQKNVVNDLNTKFITQFKQLSDTLGMEVDDIDLSENFDDLYACGLSHVDDVFKRVQQFISNLDSKKCELLSDAKIKTEKLNEACNKNELLSEEILSKDTQIAKMQESLNLLEKEIGERNNANSVLSERVAKSESELSAIREELSVLLTKEKSDERDPGQLIEIINSQKEELCLVKAQKEKISMDMDNHLTTLTEELHKVKEDLSSKETELVMKNQQIEILNESILNQQKESEILNEKYNELKNSSSKINSSPELEELNGNLREIKLEKEGLNSELSQIKNEKTELLSNMSNLQRQCDENAKQLEEFETMKSDAFKQIDQLNTEKSELINLVTQKHHESITYHNEIQRLNSILLTENERYKELERIYATTREQQNSGAAQNSEDLNRLNEMLKEKNERCAELEKQIECIKNSGVTAEELEKLREKNQFLIEKCDVLGKNLVMEQGNAKQITQEKMQILEREQNLSREVERLREHLAEMEEEQTRELVSAEQKLQEAQVKLSQAEEKVKQSSTLYTSNSIRANQEVETLRTQIKLVEKQRDEIQFQLSQSEDRNSKNLAALTNLQCVLEQFQLDKEREGEAVAGRARRDLESAREEITKLHKQIADLEEKLRDSSTGLRAASRLSAQLDARTAQVHEAKEQVTKLEDELSVWKKKYKDAVSNQQDKVDKSLVKNLLMGYIQTSNNQKPGDRIQVLRLLSTVLDFDQTECERAGLGSKSTPGGGGLGADSLAQEFIKFLEKESRPQLKVGLPNLLHLGNPQGPVTPPHTTKSESPVTASRASTNSPQRLTTPSPQQPATSKPVPIVPMTMANPLLSSATVSPITVSSSQEISQNVNQPVLNNTLGQNVGFTNGLTGGFSLFTPIANPDMVVNQTRNNEGAILKNILKDP